MRTCAFPLIAGLIAAFCACGQDTLHPAVSALPLWSGEEAAAKTPGQYVFREPSGEIVVCYPDPVDPAVRRTFRFWLQNRVDPQIEASVSRAEDGMYVYTYRLRNGPKAATVMWNWAVVGPVHQEVRVEHPVWFGRNARDAAAPQALLPSLPWGAYLAWDGVDTPIRPGAEASGFRIQSAWSPGLTTAYATGKAGTIKAPTELTREVEDQIIPLERAPVLKKTTVTLGPRFAPGTSVSAVVAAFRSDIADLLNEGLLDRNSAFVRELQQVLTRAAAVPNRGVLGVIGNAPQSRLETDLQLALKMATATVK